MIETTAADNTACGQWHWPDEPVDFRQVVGFPGYRVGTDGSVWSCLKQRGRKGFWGGTESYLSDEWKERKVGCDPDGYLQINLCRNGKVVLRKVHHLVLEAFVGPCPPGMEACHRDNNRANAALSNLRWGTRSSNCLDKRAHGTMPRGESHHRAILTEDQVRKIRQEYPACGMTQKEMAQKYGVSLCTIEKILARKLWAHLS